jgi:hypothetical protein
MTRTTKAPRVVGAARDIERLRAASAAAFEENAIPLASSDGVAFTAVDLPGVADAEDTSSGFDDVTKKWAAAADVFVWVTDARTAFLTKHEQTHFNAILQFLADDTLATARPHVVAVVLSKFDAAVSAAAAPAAAAAATRDANGELVGDTEETTYSDALARVRAMYPPPAAPVTGGVTEVIPYNAHGAILHGGEHATANLKALVKKLGSRPSPHNTPFPLAWAADAMPFFRIVAAKRTWTRVYEAAMASATEPRKGTVAAMPAYYSLTGSQWNWKHSATRAHTCAFRTLNTATFPATVNALLQNAAAWNAPPKCVACGTRSHGSACTCNKSLPELAREWMAASDAVVGATTPCVGCVDTVALMERNGRDSADSVLARKCIDTIFRAIRERATEADARRALADIALKVLVDACSPANAAVHADAWRNLLPRHCFSTHFVDGLDDPDPPFWVTATTPPQLADIVAHTAPSWGAVHLRDNVPLADAICGVAAIVASTERQISALSALVKSLAPDSGALRAVFERLPLFSENGGCPPWNASAEPALPAWGTRASVMQRFARLVIAPGEPAPAYFVRALVRFGYHVARADAPAPAAPTVAAPESTRAWLWAEVADAKFVALNSKVHSPGTEGALVATTAFEKAVKEHMEALWGRAVVSTVNVATWISLVAAGKVASLFDEPPRTHRPETAFAM